MDLQLRAKRAPIAGRASAPRVGIVGGVERNQQHYEEVASAHGCSVEFHGGHIRGRGAEALETLVERCDLIVIVTEINSHAAVRMTQKLCSKRGRRVLIVRRFGVSSFEQTARDCAQLNSRLAAAAGSAAG